MTITEFWRVTIREVLMFIQASRWRMEQQQRADIAHAWHTAALAGANFSKSGIPSLEKILPKESAGPRKPITLEQEAQLWKAWARDHNARLRRAS